MRMRLVGTMLVAGVACAAALGVVSLARAGGSERPRAVHVRAGGEQVRASQGSYCYSDRDSGRAVCADFAYPLKVRGRLPVRPGQWIRLRTHDRTIKRLSAHLLLVRGADFDARGKLLGVQRIPNRPSAWKARIPERVERANRISIDAVYERNAGDSNWWAGVKLAD